MATLIRTKYKFHQRSFTAVKIIKAVLIEARKKVELFHVGWLAETQILIKCD